MTEAEEILKDIKAVNDRYSKWYNENIMSVHYKFTHPYIGVKSGLGQARVHMESVLRIEEARKK